MALIANGGTIEEFTIHPDDVPVYICTYNRFSCTKKLIDWLLDAGTKRIVIVDNQSTYQPLLEYFKVLPTSVELHSMEMNVGPWNSWEWANKDSKTPFIFTDSDVVPADCCPKDLIAKCLKTFNENPSGGIPHCGKVGPGLRLDNVPEENLLKPNYHGGNNLKDHEAGFWLYRLNEYCFSSMIDTTFALYAPNYVFTLHWANIRLDKPYVVEHKPWYSRSPYSEEELYYRNQKHCAGTAHFEKL
jgi:hypothetical protein